MEKNRWTIDVMYEEIMHGVKKKRVRYKEGRLTGLVTYCVGTAF